MSISKNKLTYKNVKYGTLVEVINPTGGYHAGMKVYFFNHKGVLVGNIYEFLPYERLRLREEKSRQYPRYFMHNSLEGLKSILFSFVCTTITWMIKKSNLVIQAPITNGNYESSTPKRVLYLNGGSESQQTSQP